MSVIPLTDLATARDIVNDMTDLLSGSCERLEIAGSIRRGRSEVKDAEIVAIPLPGCLSFMDELVEKGVVTKALYGEAQTTRWGSKYRGMLYRGLKVEVFLADEDNWGWQLFLRTGPGDANTYVMKWLKWKRAPIQAKDGYWWWGDKRLAVRGEHEMFENILGIRYIAPQYRTEDLYKNQMKYRWGGWPSAQWPGMVIRDAETEPMAGMGMVRIDDEGAVEGKRSVDLPTDTPYLNTFRRLRDELCVEHWTARKPVLKARIAELRAQIEPIWDEMRAHTEKYGFHYDGTHNKKHEYEKIYAKMDGRDEELQRLTAEYEVICRELPEKQRMVENRRAREAID